jgi:hypothetical protein
MNSSRITLTLGAAGGGLLAAAFLQTAVAFADTTGLVSPVGPSPSPTEVFNFEPTGSVPSPRLPTTCLFTRLLRGHKIST